MPDPAEPRRRRSTAWQRWTHRARVAEAMALLTVASAGQRWIPMTRWSGALGVTAPVPPSWRGRTIDMLPQRAASAQEYAVALAVRRGCRWLPWNPTCLAEATAGQVMLRQMKCPGVVVVGLRPSPDGTSGRWDAHAWLLGRAGALTGGPAAKGFTATTVYEVPGALRAGDVPVA